MKKPAFSAVLLLLLAAVFILFAGHRAVTWYNEGKSLSGNIVEICPDEADGVSAIVLRQKDGKEVGILLDSASWVTGPNVQADGHTEAEVRTGNLVYNAEATAFCSRGRRSLTTADGRTLKAYEAWHISVYSVPTEETVTLSDGTVLRLWNNDWVFRGRTYCLEDGTQLLHEEYSPELSGSDLLRQPMSQQAWDRMESTLASQGRLYEVMPYLEQAWAEYQASPDTFSRYLLKQDSCCQTEAERVVYCVTTVTVPLGGSYVEDLPIHHVFDKATGEELDVRSLFTRPEAELRQELRQRVHSSFEPELLEQLFSVLRMEDLEFSGDALCALIPKSRLPDADGGYWLDWSYESLEGLIQPWAIPISGETAE